MNPMRRLMSAVLVLSLALPTVAAAQTGPTHRHYERPPDYIEQPAPNKPIAPRLQNLGRHTFPVSTKSSRARLFINQGMNLAYGFNHAEAARAFAEAARLDPDCAMAYWGHAFVLGPNINASMNADDEPKAYELVQKALTLKAKVTQRERDYIDALAARYTGKADDRQKANRAFADAMRALTRRWPADLDGRTILAEALMDLRPWNYWTRDGEPYAETREVEAALQYVLERNRNHPGALHYWIHLWEPTDTPERAEAEADRLLPLMPGAGHIVHMPAHIYMRVGRHADVVKSNLMAVKADEEYITQCRAQGLYPLGYYPHNIHFVWMGATASGQRALALEYARKVERSIPQEALGQEPLLQGFVVVPYWAMVRFGQWNDILADKGPRLDTAFTKGAWRYARAMAFVASEKIADAENELSELQKLLVDPSLKEQTTFSTNKGFAILRIAPEVIAGELAAKRKDWDKAVLHFERAVRYEDALIYQEPPDWHAPARQNLGAVLLQASRADEAEAVYWEDLKKNPGNGWTLFGLLQALKAQGKQDDAAMVEERFKRAWKDADFTISARY
jgi:tetratricopeptide (TPR) repeat protein